MVTVAVFPLVESAPVNPVSCQPALAEAVAVALLPAV
jgi:hypothetical protein